MFLKIAVLIQLILLCYGYGNKNCRTLGKHRARCIKHKKKYCKRKSHKYDFDRCEWVKDCCDGPKDADRPNILVIMMDDLGYNEVGYLGGDMPTTTIDGLATSGIRLNYHYSENVCSPTRAAFLTGRYPWRTGLDDAIALPNKQGIDTSIPLISEILNDNGYNTLFVGKWHVGSAFEAQLPSARGFKESFYFTQGATEYRNHVVPPFIQWPMATHPAQVSGELEPETLTTLIDALPDGLYPLYDLWLDDHHVFLGSDKHEYVERLFADDIKDFLHYNNYYNINDPWFIFWSMPTPHTPYEVPPLTTTQCNEFVGQRKLHCNMIYYADLLIDEIVDSLKQNNFYENTLIVFISDNGAQTPIPFLMGGAGNNLPLHGAKSSTFEGGIRTTSFISGGYLEDKYSGCNYNNLVYVSDFYPILADLAGINSDLGDIDGINLWNHIINECDNSHNNNPKNPNPYRNEIISFRFDGNTFQQAVIFKNGYKFILNPVAAFASGLGVGNYIQYDGTFTLLPNDEYYHKFNEFDKDNDNQKLYYSKCYENDNGINVDPLIMPNGDTVFLYKIFEDNIEACNIAHNNIDIVNEMIDILNEKLVMYNGSGGVLVGEKGAYEAVSDSYDCDNGVFFAVKWAANPLYQNSTNNWNDILLSYIDQVEQCNL